MKKIILLNLMLVVSIAAVAQQVLDQKKLQQYLSIQKERLGFSGTVLVTKNGKAIANLSTGMASVELGIPITEKNVFAVASISKSFTATLVLLAVAEKKLKLSDSLAQFFPQLTDLQWRSITIDQLLSHRSGIPHNEGIVAYWTEKSTISYARVPAMREIFSLKLESAPGSRAKYSSPGYFVLASILENLYGKSYGELVTEKISGPIKLRHTGQLDNSTLVSGLVAGYVQESEGLIMAPYRSYSLMKGSGNLYTSGQDLITFLDSFATPLWPSLLYKQMFSPHSVEAVERGDLYGYGWFIREKLADRPKAFYHGGGSYGVSTLMARYPEEKISIVILCNVSVMPVNQIWSDIEDIVLGKPFDLPIVRASMPIAAETLVALSGSYTTSNQMDLAIFSEAGKLYAKMGNRPPFEIFQQQGLKFYGKKVAIDLIFSIDKGEKAIGINVTGMGQRFDFKRK